MSIRAVYDYHVGFERWLVFDVEFDVVFDVGFHCCFDVEVD